MTDDDIGYYERRATVQVELAERASHPNAVKAHYLLAEAYLQRISMLAAVASFERENRLH